MKKKFATVLTVFAVCIAVAGYAISSEKTPPIADQLPSNFQEGDQVFKARIVETFPLGSPEKVLVETLAAQGFDVDKVKHTAFFRKMHFPCQLSWHIAWETNAEGAITNLSPQYNGVCP